MSEKRFKGIKILGKKPNEIFIKDKEKDYYIRTEDEVVDLLNEQQATIQSLKEENEQLLRCKYFVKAVEVFTDCPISETIADYSDGELFDEEEQLEFGKKMLKQEKELVEDE